MRVLPDVVAGLGSRLLGATADIEPPPPRSTRSARMRGDGLDRPLRWTRGVTYDVTYADARLVGPDGVAIRVPRSFTWRVPGVLELHGEVDGPLLHGLGSGYVGGYRHHGVVLGDDVVGRGYLEWIDRA